MNLPFDLQRQVAPAEAAFRTAQVASRVLHTLETASILSSSNPRPPLEGADGMGLEDNGVSAWTLVDPAVQATCTEVASSSGSRNLSIECVRKRMKNGPFGLCLIIREQRPDR